MSEDSENRSSILSHLLELRRVIIVCAVAVSVAFCAIFGFLIDYFMRWIAEPIRAKGVEIIYTTVSEALMTKFKVSFVLAVVVSSPVIVWQVWKFIKPGLYPSERRWCRILFFVALLLFLVGVVFCYSAVYWLAVDFFLVQGSGLATPLLSLDRYVGFLFSFILPFGCAFQLPVALYLTTRLGLTRYETLAATRRYVLLGIFIVAAILTPPDVVSQIALGVPLYALYEVGIQVSRLTTNTKKEL
ncbi:MAG: twin-arginine translocase subunit TatC [Synergistaceae bacterium]|nr:twin-arginine translocase subunit TatC [Synergistaceae bacterium]MBR0094054.1 twin-arginine translocase subunit TatC [Synergistaceae bacterium]